MTLLLAGHETTATALAWTFDLLLRHPRAAGSACATRWRRARTTTCGRRSPSRCACARSCRWPAAGSPRSSTVDGLNLPAGHRRHARRSGSPTPAPTSTPSPSPSAPSASSTTGPETYGWIPFGGGIRRCLGAAFAEFEMRIVLREVLTRCELHKAEPGAGEDRPPQHHPLAQGRHPGRSSPPAARRASLKPSPPSAATRRLATGSGGGGGCSLAQRAIVPEPETTSPSSRTRIGTSLVPLSFLTSARSSSRLAPGPGHQPVAADRLQLVLVAGVVERLARLARRDGRRPGRASSARRCRGSRPRSLALTERQRFEPLEDLGHVGRGRRRSRRRRRGRGRGAASAEQLAELGAGVPGPLGVLLDHAVGVVAASSRTRPARSGRAG